MDTFSIVSYFINVSGVTAAFGWGSAPAAPSESECRPYIEKALKELSADTTAPGKSNYLLCFVCV